MEANKSVDFKTPPKDRDLVVSECAKQVTVCWQHYSDNRLPEGIVELVKQKLDGVMPALIESTGWQAYADAYAEEQELLDQEE